MTTKLWRSGVVFCIWPIFTRDAKIQQSIDCWHLQADVNVSGWSCFIHISGASPKEPAYANTEEKNPDVDAIHSINHAPFPTQLARSRKSLEKSGVFDCPR